MDVSADDVRDYVLYQVAALDGFAHGLHHVKPHGALYMMALDDAAIARAIAEAVASYQEGLPVYTLAGSELWDAAAAAGLPAVAEFFADRPLRADGSVVMFGWQELFTPTPEAVGLRVRSLLETGTVPALGGIPVAVQAETVCVHSDTPRADELGEAVRAVIGDRASVRGAHERRRSQCLTRTPARRCSRPRRGSAYRSRSRASGSRCSCWAWPTRASSVPPRSASSCRWRWPRAGSAC